jgi:divalent metal cation (Fe/Co/Zn/Cd) transporter
MDAVDPALIDRIERYAGEVEGVKSISRLRARWVGHQLFAEMTVMVDEQLSLVESHHVLENIQRALKTAVPHLGEIYIHAAPDYQYEAV